MDLIFIYLPGLMISIGNLRFLKHASIADKQVEQTSHFFDSFFLKVSVGQFSQSRYIPIRNQQGGGADISSFPRKKPGIRRKLS